MTLQLFLKILAVTWFVVNFEPLQETLSSIMTRVMGRYSVADWLFNSAYTILSCHKCLSFWSTLVITHDFPSACLTALAAHLITKYTTS